MKTININLREMVARTNGRLVLVESFGQMHLKLAHPVVPNKDWLLTFTPIETSWQVKRGNLSDLDELIYRLKTLLAAEDFDKFVGLQIIENAYLNTTWELVACSEHFLKKMKEKIDKDERPWLEYQSYIAESNKVGIKESPMDPDMSRAFEVPQGEVAILTTDGNNSQRNILMSTGAFPCFIFAAYNRKEKKGLLTHIDYGSDLEVVLALLSQLGDRKDIDLHIVGGQFQSINQGVLLIELTKMYGTYQTICLLSEDHRNFALNISTGEIHSSTIDRGEVNKKVQRLEAPRFNTAEIIHMPLQEKATRLVWQLKEPCCIYLRNYGEEQHQPFKQMVDERRSTIISTINSHRSVTFTDPLIYSGKNTADKHIEEKTNENSINNNNRDKTSLHAMLQFPNITMTCNFNSANTPSSNVSSSPNDSKSTELVKFS